MVQITERAGTELRRLLAEHFARPQQGVRLRLNQSGDLRMTIDVPHAGDSVIRRDNVPVLIVDGRLAVVTFHSLEDRIVKTFFKERATEFIDRPEWPEPRPNPKFIFKRITHKPTIASEAEQRANPRSRSAKLRVVERIPYVRQ